MPLSPDYQARLSELHASLVHARTVQTGTLIMLAATVALFSLLVWLAFQRRVPAWSTLLPVPLAAAAGRRYIRNRSGWLRTSRLERFYQDGLARLENRFAGLGFPGDEFQVAGHPYAADLNLFGVGSLFESLCTARTEIGRRRLAEYLLTPTGIDESSARQEAVRELVTRPALREDIPLLGKFDSRDSSSATFADWLANPIPWIAPPVRWLAVGTSLALGLLILFTYVARPVALHSWIEAAPWMAGLALVNVIVAGSFRRTVKKELEFSNLVGLEIGVVREGIALLQGQRFESAKLCGIVEELKKGGAATVLLRLERMTAALHVCAHPFFEFVCHVLIMKTHLALGLAHWRQRHGESLKRWLRAWAEFEALAAMAGYACEHPHDTFPELIQAEVVLDGCELGHPMIPAAACVRNHIALGAGRRLYVISGSNMAGKSTLLRAIGMNAVLAYAGAPVRAASLRISLVAVCASLSVVDSMVEGKSRFLAEVEKLRQMTTFARGQTPVLFLIDEILGGTNSRDRRIAAEAVVRSLVASGAVGALSTHDLALAEIAEIEGLGGANVHMGSRDGSDPLDFDYLLKPGVTRESNAIAIARMAGVPA